MTALKSRLTYGMLPQALLSLSDFIAEGIRQGEWWDIDPEVSESITALRTNDHEFMLDLVHREPKALRYIGDALRYHLPFIREVASIAPQSVFGFFGDVASADAQTVRTVITADDRSGSSIRGARRSLREDPTMQWLAFRHGATVEDLGLNRLGALKARFVYTVVKNIWA